MPVMNLSFSEFDPPEGEAGSSIEAQLSSPFPPPGVKSVLAINCRFTSQTGMRESLSSVYLEIE